MFQLEQEIDAILSRIIGSCEPCLTKYKEQRGEILKRIEQHRNPKWQIQRTTRTSPRFEEDNTTQLRTDPDLSHRRLDAHNDREHYHRPHAEANQVIQNNEAGRKQSLSTKYDAQTTVPLNTSTVSRSRPQRNWLPRAKKVLLKIKGALDNDHNKSLLSLKRGVSELQNEHPRLGRLPCTNNTDDNTATYRVQHYAKNLAKLLEHGKYVSAYTVLCGCACQVLKHYYNTPEGEIAAILAAALCKTQLQKKTSFRYRAAARWCYSLCSRLCKEFGWKGSSMLLCVWPLDLTRCGGFADAYHESLDFFVRSLEEVAQKQVEKVLITSTDDQPALEELVLSFFPDLSTTQVCEALTQSEIFEAQSTVPLQVKRKRNKEKDGSSKRTHLAEIATTGNMVEKATCGGCGSSHAQPITFEGDADVLQNSGMRTHWVTTDQSIELSPGNGRRNLEHAAGGRVSPRPTLAETLPTESGNPQLLACSLDSAASKSATASASICDGRVTGEAANAEAPTTLQEESNLVSLGNVTSSPQPQTSDDTLSQELARTPGPHEMQHVPTVEDFAIHQEGICNFEESCHSVGMNEMTYHSAEDVFGQTSEESNDWHTTLHPTMYHQAEQAFKAAAEHDQLNNWDPALNHMPYRSVGHVVDDRLKDDFWHTSSNQPVYHAAEQMFDQWIGNDQAEFWVNPSNQGRPRLVGRAFNGHHPLSNLPTNSMYQ